MRILLLILTMGIASCSSPKHKTVTLGSEVPQGKAELIHEKHMFQMSRQETINAINDCHSANLRAIIYHSRLKVTGRFIPIPVSIQCAPKIK